MSSEKKDDGVKSMELKIINLFMHWKKKGCITTAHLKNDCHIVGSQNIAICFI